MNSSLNSPLISLNNIRSNIKLNNGEKLITVNKINLTLENGYSYAIVGKSGSGKTSLISIIGLLNSSYKGKYLYKGIEMALQNDTQRSFIRANDIGFVFQNYSLIKHLNVYENIELPLLYAKSKYTKKERKKLIIKQLEKVGLQGRELDFPNHLSGGEQQRVAIARALVISPEIILCDEPTGALDKKTGQKILKLLLNLVKEKNALLLLVTHDLDIANQCDIVLKMDEGRIKMC